MAGLNHRSSDCRSIMCGYMYVFVYFVHIGPFSFKVVCRVFIYPLCVIVLVLFNKLHLEYQVIKEKYIWSVYVQCIRFNSRNSVSAQFQYMLVIKNNTHS